MPYSHYYRAGGPPSVYLRCHQETPPNMIYKIALVEFCLAPLEAWWWSQERYARKGRDRRLCLTQLRPTCPERVSLSQVCMGWSQNQGRSFRAPHSAAPLFGETMKMLRFPRSYSYRVLWQVVKQAIKLINTF